MEGLELEEFRVTGNISVEPVARIPDEAVVYIIMGPTGAGKSTFIEALAGGSQNLAISSNQLAGYTQRVTAYKLVNIARKQSARAIYLVDTPGFSDSKISEMEVVDMLRDWLKENCHSPARNERTRSQAEQNFERLKAGVFKGFFGEETDLKRFMGTRTSALQVLDSNVWYYDQPLYRSTITSTHLYCDLHERIEAALQKKVMIESDLTHSDTQSNKVLEAILEQDQKENDETLAKFISQLVKFGRPPPEFQEGAQALRKTIVANIVPANHRMCDNFQQWAEDPEIHNGLVSDPELKETILAMLPEKRVSHKRPKDRAETLPSIGSISDQGRDSMPIQTETISAMGPESEALVIPVNHGLSRSLAFKGLLRRLLKFAKRHRPKWLQREE
ncbi:hypothetical protein BJ165DRAFT_1599146 [Panaeolus papilionaceus]|nr:hypothetical protein BJ165DRAFT_1599146 [Panaeolus papilionaceus]